MPDRTTSDPSADPHIEQGVKEGTRTELKAIRSRDRATTPQRSGHAGAADAADTGRRTDGGASSRSGGAVLMMHVREEIESVSVATTDALSQAMLNNMGDAPACDVCGQITVRNGTCYKCLNCGNSMGCS